LLSRAAPNVVIDVGSALFHLGLAGAVRTAGAPTRTESGPATNVPKKFMAPTRLIASTPTRSPTPTLLASSTTWAAMKEIGTPRQK
jgi:hypothetical protein